MAILFKNTSPAAFFLGSKTISKILFKENAVWENGPDLSKPLTFTATGDSSVQLTQIGSPEDISLEYSFDGFKTDPISYTIGAEIKLTDGQSVSMRAVSTNNTIGRNQFNTYKFVMSGNIAASGNIQSLLDKTCQRMDVLAYCYRGMFEGCSSLTQAPELPATTLARNCYSDMFYGCAALTAAPELPATTLATECYNSMFGGCAALTAAPALPATTLAYRCYSYMFQSCTSLTQAPKELPATTLANWCYTNMFKGCSALTAAPELPATTLATYCYHQMFQSCSALTTAPELQATTLADSCYQYMFSASGISEFTVDMTACTSVPSLPSSTLFSSAGKSYTVLVPASLYDEWIQATNWSTIVDNIQAV